jgi:hypothetical protein
MYWLLELPPPRARRPAAPAITLPSNIALRTATTAPPPVTPYDFSKPYFPSVATDKTQPTNINLFTNPIPFYPVDLSRPFFPDAAVPVTFPITSTCVKSPRARRSFRSTLDSSISRERSSVPPPGHDFGRSVPCCIRKCRGPATIVLWWLMMKKPTEAEFKTAVSDGAVTVIFQPTKSTIRSIA